MNERLNITGKFTLTIRELDGTLVSRRQFANTMCNYGMGALANFLVSNLFIGSNSSALVLPSAPPIYMAVGNGTTTPAATDTTLAAELAREPITTAASPTPSSSQIPSFSWYTIFPTSGSTWSISEAGVFLNATSTANSGALLDHSLISPAENKSATQIAELQVTFTLS